MLVLLVGTVLAACPATPASVAAAVTEVERGFAALDKARVTSAGDHLEAQTACLAEPVDRALAVRVHAAAGLAAFVRGDEDAAAAAFAAARRLDPAWSPDPSLVPKGHPIRALATRLDPASVTTGTLPAPARGELRFDGAATRARPREVPTVAQWIVDGDVVSSGYVWPDAPMLPYDAATTGTTSARDSSSARPAATWLGVGGAGVVLSAASFYLAGRSRAAWEQAEGDEAIISRYRTNHLFWGLGAGFGVVAVVGGAGAAVSVAW